MYDTCICNVPGGVRETPVAGRFRPRNSYCCLVCCNSDTYVYDVVNDVTPIGVYVSSFQPLPEFVIRRIFLTQVTLKLQWQNAANARPIVGITL